MKTNSKSIVAGFLMAMVAGALLACTVEDVSPTEPKPVIEPGPEVPAAPSLKALSLVQYLFYRYSTVSKNVDIHPEFHPDSLEYSVILQGGGYLYGHFYIFPVSNSASSKISATIDSRPVEPKPNAGVICYMVTIPGIHKIVVTDTTNGLQRSYTVNVDTLK